MLVRLGEVGFVFLAIGLLNAMFRIGRKPVAETVSQPSAKVIQLEPRRQKMAAR